MKTPSPQEAAKTVRELPILFAPDLAQKVYLGLKTETRRLVKRDFADSLEDGGNRMIETDDGLFPVTNFAPYQPGDLLYVRETWGTIKEYDRLAPRNIPVGASIGFRTDPIEKWCQTGCNGAAGKWRPSIHMPKWAARTWLEVLSVSVERIQNVMEGDAIAEGYESGVKSASDQFWDSWDKRYPGSTNRNDWVFVYKFKKVEAPNGRD